MSPSAPSAATWLSRLRGDDPQAQVEALRAWVQSPLATTPQAHTVWRAVERLALRASAEPVRAAALQALTSPAARAFYHAHSTWPPAWRASLRREIEAWAREGLITPAQAAVLQARYGPPPSKPSLADIPAEAPPQRRAAPWSLQVVLYLGAFFVIAAALLFAAVVETWRLPILLTATVLFMAAAAATYRLEPTGSRVLGIVAAGFLWADAGVLYDLLSPSLYYPWDDFYWAGAFMLLAALWLLGGWLLRSTVLTLAAWPMLAASLLRAWSGLQGLAWGNIPRISWLLLAWSGEVVLALLWARWIRGRQATAARWLWGTAHGTAVALLFFMGPLAALDAPGSGAPWVERLSTWGVMAAAFAMLLAFYLLSRALMHPLPWMEAWAVPLALAGVAVSIAQLGVRPWQQALLWVVFALLSAAAAVGLRRLRWGMPRAWSWGMELLAGLAWMVAGFILVDAPYSPWWGWAVWMLGGLWGWGEALRTDRITPAGFGWLLVTLAWLQALGNIWPWPEPPYWPGWMLLLPLLGVLLDVLGRGLQRRRVRWVARGGAAVYALLVWATAMSQSPYRLREAAVLAVLAFGVAGYARLGPWPKLWAVVPLLGLATWGVFLDALGGYHPATLGVWPVVAVLAAWAGTRRAATPGWRAWRWGALAIAWLTALLTLPYDDGWSALTLAVMATLTGVVAWQTRSMALVLPTAALYFWAYAWTLNLWDVRQPQWYTIPAAALGLLLHALYRRTGHQVTAFVMGALAQLVLFTTTYVQMVSHRSGWYFAMLFLQGLVVLGYGLWSNAPALIWPPIGFVVLATVTIVLIQFQGLGVLALLCGAGLALLAGGLFVLTRRARQQPAAGPEGEKATNDDTAAA